MGALGVGGVSARCFSVSGGSGAGAGGELSKKTIASACVRVGFRKSWRFRRSRVVLGVSSCDYFREKDHLDYYSNYSSHGGSARGVRAEKMVAGNLVEKGKSKETKMKMKEKKTLKKMLKKMLQTQIQADMDMPIPSETAGLLPDRVKVAKMMISNSADILLEQLQQLKLEGADLKIAMGKDSEMMSSSSSSSESSESDCECGEVVTDMASLKMRTPLQNSEHGKPLQAEAFSAGILGEDVKTLNHSFLAPVPAEAAILNHAFLPPVPAEAAILNHAFLPPVPAEAALVSVEQNHPELLGESTPRISEVTPPDTNTRESPLVVAKTVGVSVSPSQTKIEVCMGGKCKKSGSVGLLGEFERLLGRESTAVSGCKCMGRCRDGPNVRIVDDDPVGNKTTDNSLCIGVALKDVGLIVENFIARSPEPGFSVGF